MGYDPCDGRTNSVSSGKRVAQACCSICARNGAGVGRAGVSIRRGPLARSKRVTDPESNDDCPTRSVGGLANLSNRGLDFCPLIGESATDNCDRRFYVWREYTSRRH